MSQKTYATITYAKSEGVATITLNRPEVLNAFNEQMGEEFAGALRSAERDPEVRCVVITGAGRAFSAGEDIQALREQYERGEDPRLGQRLHEKYNPIIQRIREMEKPVIAAVNGVAAGAGASLAYATDYRIASDKASFIQAFIKVGLAPDSGSSFLLTRLVGFGKALELAMLGDRVDAKEAERLGIVNRLVPHEQLESSTKDLALMFAKGPTKAIALTKRAMNRATTGDLRDALEYEAYLQSVAGRTLDHKEAVKAFFEKREPVFHGT